MAKGVGGLLGRADATLVGAATRASLAAVPKDLSGVHQRTAAAYASMARTTGAVYGKALEVVGQIGGKLIENARINTLEPESQWSDNQMGGFEKKPDAAPKPSVDPIEVKPLKPGVENVITDPELDPPGVINIPGAGDAGLEYTYTDNNGNTEAITVQTTNQKLEELRDELKNVKKLGLDRKGRRAERGRIRNAMDMIRQENVTFGAFQKNMTTMLAQDQINFEASGIYGMGKMLFSQALLAAGKPVKQTDPNLAAYDGARAIQGYDKNGRMIFTYVDKYGVPFKNEDGSNMTIDKSSIASGDLFIAKSEKRPIMDGLINTQFIQKNYKAGFQDFENLINKGVDENITDKNTFLDIAHYHSSNTTGSLASVLNNVEYNEDGVPQIKETEMSGLLVGALQGLSNKNQFDVSGDGVFDEKDYATQENYAMLVKKVLSGDDLQLGKSLLKAHYKNATNAQIEKFKGLEPDPVTNELTPGQKRYYDAMAAQDRINLSRAELGMEQREKTEAEQDTQNLVYNIEREFSRGDTRIGSGTRFAVLKEATDEIVDDDGNVTTPAQPKQYMLYDGTKIIDSVDFNSPEALDEIVKHTTGTEKLYRNYRINQSYKPTTEQYNELVKTLPNLKPGQPIYYQGDGNWDLKQK